MSNLVFRSTGIVVKLLESVIKSRLRVHGAEHLSDNPTLFVVNHFTRMETFLLPYILYKQNKKHTRSLAYKGLFVGALGSYLRKLGTVSTDEPLRNRIIIRDLMTSKSNWVIYPEGVMLKTKKFIENGRFTVDHPNYSGPPHTGAAVLALKAEIYRELYFQAVANDDHIHKDRIRQEFYIPDDEEISQQGAVIVPVNITYYPIRPGENILTSLLHKFMDKVPERLEEELEIEGNLLLNESDIDISFAKPVQLSEYLGGLYKFIKYIPSISQNTKNNYYLNLRKRRLTNIFMERIYRSVTVNLDHLFCAGLKALSSRMVMHRDFKRAVFLTAYELNNKSTARLHSSLKHNVIKLVAGDTYTPLHSVFNLAEKEKIIDKLDEDRWTLDREMLSDTHDFHDVRVMNTIYVLANEIGAIDEATRRLNKYVNMNSRQLTRKVHEACVELDQRLFEKDYLKYYDHNFSKEKNIGRPYFLKAPHSSCGILLSHGYKAAPEETRLMGEYLHKLGYNVYGVRLKGHGTSPRNIQTVSWKDWYDSFNRGYAALSNYCDKVIIGGFSMGGLLALMAAQRKKFKPDAVFCINTPLRLKDIRSRVVPAINFWNELLEKFHIDKGKYEYVSAQPENPGINYTRNYLHGVEELNHLMQRVEKDLDQVDIPTLIMQAQNDPVVDPKSADLIYNSISSSAKQFIPLDFDRHVVLRKEGCETVFEKAAEFVDRIFK